MYKQSSTLAIKIDLYLCTLGALGQSTDFIVKQPNTVAIKIDLYLCTLLLCCRKRNSGLMQKLHVQTIKYTGIKKFEVCLAFNSDDVCRIFNVYLSNF